MDGAYRNYLVETFHYSGGGSRHATRARPLADQGVDTSIYVECSSAMRNSQTVGTVFQIWAKLTAREDGAEFLYTSYQWPYKVIQRDEVAKHILGNDR